jgi:predicted XRE-type DNA-binding protein
VLIKAGNGNVYEHLDMNEAEGMAAKTALADQIQDGISAGGLSKENAAKQLGITPSKLSELLRGQFHTISEADMRDYIGRLYIPLAAPAKSKRQRVGGDKMA